jgi:predicted nucleic acid-binding Zn ribbon protein
VGPGIAAVTTPLRVSRGALVVAVRSSSWLMELKLMEREIVRRINAGRPRGRIARIHFVMEEATER